MLKTKSSAPLGPKRSSLDTAYAQSWATSAVMLDLTRAARHLVLNVCQLSHDVLLIKLKPFLSGCLNSLLGSQTGEASGSFTHSKCEECAMSNEQFSEHKKRVFSSKIPKDIFMLP